MRSALKLLMYLYIYTLIGFLAALVSFYPRRVVKADENPNIQASFIALATTQVSVVAELGIKQLLPSGFAEPNKDKVSWEDREIYSESGSFLATTASAISPTIDIWYGSNQTFGHLGNPQPWANILGNVSDPVGIASLVYSLNGGPASSLSIGPDNYRLENPGDFNIDIDTANLLPGANQVTIIATDTLNNQTVKNVTVNFQSGNIWPIPYSIDWNSASTIQDAAQVVDGLWALNGQTIRPLQPGYDRLVAIGDVSWTDYEVTVPVTIHSLDYEPSSTAGVGLVMRWQGHDTNGTTRSQPINGWLQHGAILWYHRWANASASTARLKIHSINATTIQNNARGRTLSYEIPYYFKARAESVPGGDPLYSFKVWEVGQPEPSTWDIIAEGKSTSTTHGSVLFVLHKSDASFGNVTITPLGTAMVNLTVNANPTTGGTVTKNPNKSSYLLNEEVTLTATPNSGWTFTGWSGDLSGTTNPQTLLMDDNKVVTATFTQNQGNPPNNNVYLPIIIR